MELSERERGCHSNVLSDKWVFFSPTPTPCNKSWHLFVTYDCITDCFRQDSIFPPTRLNLLRLGPAWRGGGGRCGSDVLSWLLVIPLEEWRRVWVWGIWRAGGRGIKWGCSNYREGMDQAHIWDRHTHRIDSMIDTIRTDVIHLLKFCWDRPISINCLNHCYQQVNYI